MWWFWTTLKPSWGSNSNYKWSYFDFKVAKALKKGVVNCAKLPNIQKVYPSQICFWGVPWAVPGLKPRGGRLFYGNVLRSLSNSSSKYGNKSFSIIGPRIFNNLPLYVTTSISVQSFKQSLKTYLFLLPENELEKLYVWDILHLTRLQYFMVTIFTWVYCNELFRNSVIALLNAWFYLFVKLWFLSHCWV